MSPDRPSYSLLDPVREPPPEARELNDLLLRAVDGDIPAAHLLFKRYQRILLHAIRRRLPPELRRLGDSFDYANAVWATTLEEVRKGKQFDTPAAFVGFIQEVARRDLLSAIRHYLQTAKRCLRREEPAASHAKAMENRPGREGDPADRASLRDELRALIYRLLPGVQRTNLEILLEGADLEDLPERMQRSCAALRKLIRRHARVVA